MTQDHSLITENEALRQRVADLEAQLLWQTGPEAQHLGALLKHAPGGITLFSADGRLKFVSASIKKILGYEPEEMHAGDPDRFIHPEDLPQVRTLFHSLSQMPGKTGNAEYRMLHKDGSWHWMESTGLNLLHQPTVNALAFIFQDITALKKTQERLLELNQTLEARLSEHTHEIEDLYNNAPCGYHSLDASGNFVHINQTELNWLGYRHEEMVGRMNITQLLTSAGLETFRENYPKLIKNGIVADLEFDFRRKDGSLLPVLVNATAFYDEQGHYLKSRSTVIDNSKRKMNELALRESEETYRALFNDASDAIFLFTPDGTLVRTNSRSAELIGFTAEEMVGHSVAEFILPADKEDGEKRVRHVVAGQNVPVYERTMKRKDGTQIETEIRLSLLKDGAGQPKLIQSLVRDITARKQAEAELKISEARLRSILENAPATILEIDSSGLILTQNRPLMGARLEDLVGHNLMELSPPENQPILKEVMQTVFTQQQRYSSEFDVPKGPLAGHYFLVFVGPVTEGEQVTMAIVILLDITEFKKAEIELNAQRDFTRQIIETMGQGLVVSDEHARVEYINPHMARLIGVPQEKLIGSDAESYIVPEDMPILNHFISAGMQGTSNQYEFRLRTATGEIRHMLITSTPRLRSGRVIGRIALFTDITRDKELEARLRQNRDELISANAQLEKAARMKDEFLASMSHELRTPLTGILGLSEALMLNNYGPLNEKQLKALTNIQHSGQHLLELINDILDLSKIEAGKFELQIEPCLLSDICNASLQLIKGMAQKKNQQVHFSSVAEGTLLRADARRLKQMLLNLLSNAVKFTPEAGTIGLDVKANPLEGRIELTVWDTGIGISANNIKRLFKPFVQLDSSLTRQHSGTGLGLSLVHRMAELHGGSLLIESTLNEGSRFTILLPWAPQGTTPASAQVHKKDRALKSSLTVDDNEIETAQISRYLEQMEILNNVLFKGENAVSMAAQTQPGIILLDLHLPDKSGFEILTELKANVDTRNIPVVIISVQDSRAEAQKYGAAGYLLKPFSLAEMRAEINRVMAEQKRGASALTIATPPQGPTILVMDDNETSLEIITDYLSEHHLNVVTAGAGAINLVQEYQPHLILLDIQRSGINSAETIQRLRKLTEAPIIAITSLVMPGDREACLAAGASDYWIKPLQLQNLLDTLQRTGPKTDPNVPQPRAAAK
jgi:PAS domain S-box-containing protein